jgi:hypothetical protein
MFTSDSDSDKTPREEPKEGASEVVIISSDSESNDRGDSRDSDSQKTSHQAKFRAAPHVDEHLDTDPQPVSLFAYAMQHGKFPTRLSQAVRQQPTPEPAMLTDGGYLWNAVPRRTSKYLDNEAVHSGSSISSGTTGTSDGSLSDDFVVTDEPQDKPTVEDLEMLTKIFPKTFAAKVTKKQRGGKHIGKGNKQRQ